ncbi:esterase/lipase family protein [Haladaptatus sp. DFWS20]|uniref:esterase/lipase family protein n=1 Tax=Haladaptatus sp. DFWS20 TaxID=3403467 RepID=UPI003EC0B6A3
MVDDTTSDTAPNHRVSRRTVLRGTATAAVGLAGVAGTAAGFEGDDGDIVGPADFPRATTRGHFDIHWWYGDQLTDGHTATDYSTVGDVPGYGSANPEEVMISVHGWLVEKDVAPDHFQTVKTSLRNNGYDHPVIGFSYDSDTSVDNWWPATDIAERNGAKLANFITDYRAQTGARVRLIGHSLGGRVVPATIKALNSWEYRDYVESATLLGAAADNDSVAVDGEYGDDIANVVGSLDNFWKDGDNVLNWAYSTGEFDSAVGEEGCEGTPLANYTDHNVDYVPDHFSYQEPGDGCMSEVVAQF